MRRAAEIIAGALFAASAGANEVTVQNDSLASLGSGAIVWGFVSGEKAAVWLTSPCAGNVVAAQVYWQSPSGTEADAIESAIEIFRSGTFPNAGALQATIGGPVLKDGVINEWRYTDENNTVPLSVPVALNEKFIVSLEFDAPPVPSVDPSVVRDADGNPGGRNTIYANLGASFQWLDSKTLGVNGDWVIRAVVDCQSVVTQADVSAVASASPTLYTPGQPLTYTLLISNAGPAASPSTAIIDTFPSAFTNVAWTCTPSGGANCNGSSGVGNIFASNVNLPSGSSVTYTVDGTVANSATGTMSNSVTAVVGSPANDPSSTNNTGSVDTPPLSDRIFADGFGP